MIDGSDTPPGSPPYAPAVKLRSAMVLAVTGLLVATPALAADVGVRVGNFYFEDRTAGDGRVVVDMGDRIVFTFEGNNTHTATVDGLFDSGDRNGGETYTTSALMRPGTYTLYCTIHGARQHGATLQVRGSASAPPSPTRAASPSPSPARTAAASPRPVATTAAPSPRPSPSASPKPSPTPSPKPSPSISVIAAPALPSPAPPASADSPTPSSDAVALPRPAGSDADDDSGTGWLLPAALALLVLGLVATAIGLRRRGTGEPA